MSLNLRFGLADDGDNRWEIRKKRLFSFFEHYRPDFIAFQEANAFQIEFLCNILQGHRYIGKRSPAPPFWQNNVLFYPDSWVCRWSDHFFLSDTPNVPSRFPESKWPRQCTLGAFTREDRCLVCVSTHLDFDARVQIRSVHIIQRRLKGRCADVPVILMGDFNATPDAPCHAALTAPEDSDSKDALVFKNAFSPPYPPTFHGFSGKTDVGHIDWILYRGNIVPLGTRVITETFDGGYPSDHFPLLAEFCWNGAGRTNLRRPAGPGPLS